MIGLKHILGAGLLGVAGYLFLVSFVIDAPLTNTINADYLAFKTRHLLADAGKRRIVILAGSNGRFSHRCALIEREYKVPCTNMSVTADLSLSWQLRRLLPLLAKGDLLYLPLEYSVSPDVGVEAPYLVRFDWHGLANYTWREKLSAFFTFNLGGIFSAASEMALAAAGVKRRYSVRTLTPNGDERGHTAQRGRAYQHYLATRPKFTVTAARFGPRYWKPLEPLREAERRGIIVVGGLPTLFDRATVTDQAVDALRAGYARLGACFVALPNKSQYPSTDFYDTVYHLNEAAQIRHTEAIAPKLLHIFRQGGCRPHDATSGEG